ncbi:uncharacterized protein LOC125242066 [Leguminivora glycinivorella]|uniref:uncharacterized protein LOC125242066 n=1 Tax=Leguminivora glycinivorella TaxID=1035111 RepID=UPI00200FECA9|nr:uncharacterized protein LOC125242066 [Leguminivora glycinivorella]
MITNYSIIFLLMFQIIICKNYQGESFPKKYLEPEDVVPASADATNYLQNLGKILDYFVLYANKTCINRALGMFYMKAILKRTVLENKNKIQEDQHKLIKKVILQADNILSHFFASIVNPLDWGHILKRASHLLKEDDLQVEAIGEFKGNLFKKWILSDVSLNEYEQDMDELKFPKEIYLKHTEEVVESTVFTINIDDSDYCLGEIIYNPLPLEDTKILKPCVYDQFCPKILYYRAPSFSYSLSHRMLNIMMARHVRRCYLSSPEDDEQLMEALCAGMYREAVYLARRGYFNRDIWMEHISLCGMLGYQEFFRRHWFRKVVSWIDERGCIAENFNYEANRTRYLLEKEPEKAESTLKLSRKVLSDPCSWHPMALSIVVLAHGVRHAVHFREVDKVKDEL